MGPTTDARRVLCLEASRGGVIGGSLTGALELLPRLDRTRFAPALVLAEPKPVASYLGESRLPVTVDSTLFAVPRRAPGSRSIRGAWAMTDLAWRTLRALRVLRGETPALVYLANGLGPHVPMVVAAARRGIPVVCHLKGFRHSGPVERATSRRLHTAIAMTDEIAAHHRAQGLRPGRFVTIPDGVDCAAFARGGGPAVRRALGIAPEVPLAGSVGHVQEWKGQMLAIDALALARRELPALHCVIVGGVHAAGAEYAARLRARVAAPDVAGHVVLAGERRDVAACLDAMDVLIHSPIRPEPFGKALLEAMAAGRAVIAPREGGPAVIVDDGRTGLLVAPRDAGALAAAMLELLRDPGRRMAMGGAGRARAEATFDIQRHVAAMERVFDEALG
jgi:glycosyltransferase involved in cell wall biosynthesis